MTNLMIRRKCNQRCVFCNNPKALEEGYFKETSVDDIKKQIDGIPKTERMVNFTGGGEPTMVRELPELIRYAKNLGFVVCLETNGMLLSYPAYVKKLKENGLDSCIVSLHSHDEKTSDFITRTPGGFRHTLRGLTNTINEGIPVNCILHTINSLNYKCLKDFVIYINKNFGVHSFGFGFIRPIAGDKESEKITPRLTEISYYLNDVLEYCKRNGIEAQIPSGLGVPACFLGGNEEFSAELAVYSNKGQEEHKKQSYSYEKVKGKSCGFCSFNQCCSGVNVNYAKLHGTDELKPKKVNLDEIFEKIRKHKFDESKKYGVIEKKKHILGRLQITRKCNQECVFCSAPPDNKELSLEQIKKAVLELKELGTTDLMLTGGEPTLNTELIEILEFAGKVGFEEFTIQTNGSNLDDRDFLIRIKKTKNIKLNISFHSSDREIFGRISGKPENYDRLLNGLKLIQELQIPAFFAIVINKLNYMSLRSHIEFIHKNFPNMKHFSFNFIDPINRAEKNSWVVPTFSETKEYIYETVDYMMKNNLTFRIEKLPLCFMKGFEEFSSDIRRGVFDEHRIMKFLNSEKDEVKDEMNVEKKASFFYAPKCGQCSLNTLCPGINPNYVKIHGYNEVCPVSVDPKKIIRRVEETKIKA